jgi:hypothetical protein
MLHVRGAIALAVIAVASPARRLSAEERSRVRLRPHVRSERLRYRVVVLVASEIRVPASPAAPARSEGRVELVDIVEVKLGDRREFETRERFDNVQAAAEGPDAATFRHAAEGLAAVTVTTTYTPEGRRRASQIDGAQDDEVRTFARNMTPMLSFRFVPAADVAAGDDWDAQWSDVLGSREGKDSGKTGTTVQYRLVGFESCGAARCARVSAHGAEAISDRGDVTGTSSFYGELLVEVDGLTLDRKHIVSTTDLTAGTGGDMLRVVTRTDVEAARLGGR